MSSNSYFTPDPDITEFTVPYGKHSGKRIEEVPRPYLHWAYNECDFRYFPEYQRAIERHMGLTPDPNIRVGNRDGKNGNRSPATQTHQNGTGTGLDGFRRAFEQSRSAALAEFKDEPEISELLNDVLDRVRLALGI